MNIYKEKVKEIRGDAVAMPTRSGFEIAIIQEKGPVEIGFGKTENVAWKDALGYLKYVARKERKKHCS